MGRKIVRATIVIDVASTEESALTVVRSLTTQVRDFGIRLIQGGSADQISNHCEIIDTITERSKSFAEERYVADDSGPASAHPRRPSA